MSPCILHCLKGVAHTNINLARAYRGQTLREITAGKDDYACLVLEVRLDKLVRALAVDNTDFDVGTIKLQWPSLRRKSGFALADDCASTQVNQRACECHDS